MQSVCSWGRPARTARTAQVPKCPSAARCPHAPAPARFDVCAIPRGSRVGRERDRQIPRHPPPATALEPATGVPIMATASLAAQHDAAPRRRLCRCSFCAPSRRGRPSHRVCLSRSSALKFRPLQHALPIPSCRVYAPPSVLSFAHYRPSQHQTGPYESSVRWARWFELVVVVLLSAFRDAQRPHQRGSGWV